jgi:hypothetical protein
MSILPLFKSGGEQLRLLSPAAARPDARSPWTSASSSAWSFELKWDGWPRHRLDRERAARPQPPWLEP